MAQFLLKRPLFGDVNDDDFVAGAIEGLRMLQGLPHFFRLLAQFLVVQSSANRHW